MFRPISVKICGLCRSRDVETALGLGAAYCGFVVHPSSKRGLSPERAAELASGVPRGRRVIVDVETPADRLEHYRDLGFDYFQIHANPEVSLATLAAWSGLVGRERLWLAPRIAPGEPFPEAVLEFADTFLIDTYSPERIGGTGRTGDWEQFAEWRERYPDRNWILAGGLDSGNATAALARTGATHIDVSGGVEAAPGEKSEARLRAFFEAVRPG